MLPNNSSIVDAPLPSDVVNVLDMVHPDHKKILVGNDEHAIVELVKILPKQTVVALKEMAQAYPMVSKAATHEGKSRPLRIFHSRLLSTTVKDGHHGVVRELDDSSHEKLAPYDYQIDGVLKLIQNGKGVHADHRHSTQLVCWETGAGKTVWGMLSIGAAYRECADKKRFRAIISVPISAVMQWRRAVKKWLTFSGAKVLVATNRKHLTVSYLTNATIVITTPSTVAEVYKEFMWLNKFAIEVPQSGGKPSKWLARFERLRAPTAAQLAEHPEWNPCASPPVPALFDLPKIDITILDEANKFSCRDTYTAQAARLLTTNSCYAALLSATPVSNSATEFADLMYTLAAEEKYQRRDFYIRNGMDGLTIKQSAIAMAHEAIVHRVPASMIDLPEIIHRRVLFHPHVGLNADGTYEQHVIALYNDTVSEAKRAVGGNAATKTVQHSMHTSRLMACVTKLDQITFAPLLGLKGAGNFNATDIASTINNPSQSLLLLHKTIVEIQATTGRRRVLAFCPLSTMLKIAVAFFKKKRQTGAVFSIDGSDGSGKRDVTVQDFLKARGSAVLFVTAAGASALNIDQGCETVVTFGSAGWSPTDIKQAFGRIHRVTQKFTCLAVELVAFAGASNAQLTELQTDKATRLQKAFHDLDFSEFRKRGRFAFRNDEDDENFEDVDEQRWKKRTKMATALTYIETCGNRIGNAKPSDTILIEASNIEEGESVPDDMQMFMNDAPPLARDFVLPVWPSRGKPRA